MKKLEWNKTTHSNKDINVAVIFRATEHNLA